MADRLFRVTVRGVFDGLGQAQRAALAAAAGDHDVSRAEFTAAGNLTYDLADRPAFTFRFLVAVDCADDDPLPCYAAATGTGRAAALAWLRARGLGHRGLRASADAAAGLPAAGDGAGRPEPPPGVTRG